MVILTKNWGNLNFPHFFGTLFTWQKRAGNYKHTLFNFPSYKFKIDTFWRENSNISKKLTNLLIENSDDILKKGGKIQNPPKHIEYFWRENSNIKKIWTISPCINDFFFFFF